MTPHPLDRPVWNALTSGWAQFALGGPKAIQLAPDYGPFAATADRSTESLAALSQCVPGEHDLWIVETDDFPAPPGMTVAMRAAIAQMVAEDVSTTPPDFDVVTLDESDAAEMLALARLTRPGPFTVATHRLAQFIGVRRDGRLVAMAGERMKLTGLSELSGVCTHPAYRGNGYGDALSRIITRRILDRGETAFLHAYEGNAVAVELYRAMGYTTRQTMTLTVLKRES
jgi:predicted GNAT family acetyltransferase